MENALLTTVLKIPQDNFDGLISGRALAIVPLTFLRLGQKFAICSERSEFGLDGIELVAWAECISCQSLEADFAATQLCNLTSRDENLAQDDAKFLAWLRVYRLPESTKHELTFNGNFAALETPLSATYNLPILSEIAFTKRKQQLENCELSPHFELENLQHQIAQLGLSNQAARMLDEDIQSFMGWNSSKRTILLDSDLSWISQITTSGNSSDGDLFEKCVRQSFIHLGFTNTLNNPKASLDPNAAGGAGGIDFYCELPYPIVGECKASKSLKVNDNKDGAPFQLIKLGQKYLQVEGFNSAIKIIMAPGELTNDAKLTAIGNQMNIMRPETLQRLVELKTAHPGSIDLLELKPCLENAPFGTDADKKIHEFIDRIEQRIKLRSHIIQSVKALKDHGDEYVSASTVRTHFNTAFSGALKMRLDNPEEAHDLLVELSSPLTGYLGRKKCAETWKGDRFYFLRELQIS
jgi:hypothetical protein